MITLGKIGYLNVLPIYYPLEQGIIPNPFSIIAGAPAALNKRMDAGTLEISAASSIEYARHWEKYYLIPNLAIGSSGPVQSVLLLSRIPTAKLTGETVLVSSQTHTSAALLRILMKRWNIDVHYETGDATKSLEQNKKPAAILCIGDEALTLRDHPDYPVRVDLGEAWQEQTGLPFIFGVWLVQRKAVQISQETGLQGSSLLLKAKEWGKVNISSMCKVAARKSSLSHEQMCSYFAGLVYDLGEREQQGLTLFYECLRDVGEIHTVPPLDFLPGL